MAIDVVVYSESWPVEFELVAEDLRMALRSVDVLAIEHVGSTAVPGLAAKPILDIDIVVAREQLDPTIGALELIGYAHRGTLGVADRHALEAPDDNPERHVYVCVEGTLHLRNHVAVRDVLRARPDLRDRYGAVKMQLSRQPGMDMAGYVEGKSAVLQEVLAVSDLSDDDRLEILRLNRRP